METLTQDFIQDGKTYMTVDREQGFQQSDLSKTQTGMMLSSRIRGILQLHLHEVNMKAVLRYDISGKKMLRHCLQSEPMGIAEYLGLLLQIVSTLEESNQYMLSLPNYLLDEQYMFVDGTLQAGGLYLTYVPSLEMLTDEPVQSILSRLASRWMAYVSELTGNKVQRILKYCQNDNFNLQELKLLLMELLGDYQQHPGTASYTEGYNSDNAGYPQSSNTYSSGIPTPPGRVNTANSHAAATHAAREAGQHVQANNRMQHTDAVNSGAAHPVLQHLRKQRGNPAPAAVSPDNRTVNPAFAAALPSSGRNGNQSGVSADPSALFAAPGNQTRSQTAGSPANVTADAEESAAKPLSSAQRTYLLAGGALLVAMVWRFGYLEHGNDMMLYGCTAITLAVGILIYMLIKGKLSGANKLKLPVFNKSKQDDEEYGSESWRWNSEPAAAGGLAMAVSGGAGYGVDPVNQRDQNIAAIFGRESSGQTGQYYDHTSMPPHGMKSDNNSRNIDPIQQHYSSSQAAHQMPPGFSESIPDTGLLSSHMATVLLDESSVMSSHSQSKVFQGYLERRELDGMHTEPIRLTPGTFVIGRAEEGVDYYEKSVGTSRNHVEMEINDQQILIKDLSSRNGTLLGSEPLVPYKSYPMQDGDSFTIARAVFTLRLT